MSDRAFDVDPVEIVAELGQFAPDVLERAMLRCVVRRQEAELAVLRAQLGPANVARLVKGGQPSTDDHVAAE